MRRAALMTADQLLDFHAPNKSVELVRGVLVVREPPGFRHGLVAMNLAHAIANFVRAHGLGLVFAAETGFKLFSNPDTVLAPDVAFIRRERIPDPPPDGYAAMAPDLAVEVLSPRDRAGKVREKVADWLNAGCRLVWVVDPRRRHARVYRHDRSDAFIDADGGLDGEDVLPGFRCALVDVL